MDTRTQYLNNTAAVVTPLEALALWVAVWEAQTGNQVQSDDTTTYYGKEICTILTGMLKGATMPYHAARAGGYAESDLRREDKFTHRSIGWYNWTPTQGGYQIPAGYGSARLSLFILPDMVKQPLTPGRKNDNRPGWEWGHTDVFILTLDENGPGGFRAETNRSRKMTFPHDIVTMARSNSIATLSNMLAKKNPELSNNILELSR